MNNKIKLAVIALLIVVSLYFLIGIFKSLNKKYLNKETDFNFFINPRYKICSKNRNILIIARTIQQTHGY